MYHDSTNHLDFLESSTVLNISTINVTVTGRNTDVTLSSTQLYLDRPKTVLYANLETGSR